MKAYLAQIRMTLLLTMRDRSVLFFSYLFPLGFLFAFGEIAHAGQGGAVAIVNMVLTIGVLGSGFFAGAMRAIADREKNILRRFKVAPINAGPILVATLVSGLATYLPLVALVMAVARVMWNMPAPANPVSLLLFIAIGVLAFRSVGGIIASVSNSMQEGQILVQLLYTPMLLLGGATIPLSILPQWLQIGSQFLPSTHFSTGLAGILLRGETLKDNLAATGALLATCIVATFIGAKLFRWDKDEKMKPSSKLWVVAVLAPFLAMGVWQAQSKTNIEKNKILARDLSRTRTMLVRNARLFMGDGKVLEQGSVLIRDGKIAQVFPGSAPEIKAEVIEGAGRTLLPGLIDTRVYLESPGLAVKTSPDVERELAAYLYCGVTGVAEANAATDQLRKLAASVESGEILGAELFLSEQATPLRRLGMVQAEAAEAEPTHNASLLDQPLVQQTANSEGIELTRKYLSMPQPAVDYPPLGNPAQAYQKGESIVMATDAGFLLGVHGATVHRELQLWVKAGIPPAVALQAATYNGARLLHAEQRIGLIREGYDANLLLVEGNPLDDISSTEHISEVIFRGERLDRSELLKQK